MGCRCPGCARLHSGVDGCVDGESVSWVPFPMRSFSQIIVPKVASGLDFHVFPFRAQIMTKQVMLEIEPE